MMLLLALGLLLPACSTLGKAALGAIGGDKGGIHASSDIQKGDRVDTLNLGGDKSSTSVGNIQAQDVQVHQSKSKSTVNAPSAKKVTINESNPFLTFGLIILCLICWALPTPKDCWSWIQSKYKTLRGKI